MARRGRIHVSQGLLIDVLHMPPDTEIYQARVDEHGNLALYCIHEDLRDLQEAESVPLYSPELTKSPDGVVWDWGSDG